MFFFSAGKKSCGWLITKNTRIRITTKKVSKPALPLTVKEYQKGDIPFGEVMPQKECLLFGTPALPLTVKEYQKGDIPFGA